MTTYIFEDQDILRSRILNSSFSELIMVTETTSNLLYRKSTVIQDASRRPLATINWSGKSFEMSGTVKRTSNMKTKAAGFKDSNWKRSWQWDPSSPLYNVEYRHHKWTATDTGSGKICAVFKSYARHVLTTPDCAQITFTKNLPEIEQMFLLMVLLRMEARRLDTDSNQPQDQSYGATDSSSQHAVQVEVIL